MERWVENDFFKKATIIARICFNATKQTHQHLAQSFQQFSLLISLSAQQHKVQCSENEMKVLVALPEKDARVYLEGLNGYKNVKCEPKIEEDLAVFELSLVNFYDCGIIRVVNKLTVSGGVRLIS